MFAKQVAKKYIDWLEDKINKGRKLPIHDIIGSVSSHIHYDLSLKVMQLILAVQIVGTTPF